MSAIKTQTESGLVRTLYGREPGEEPLPVIRQGLGGAGYPLALATIAAALLFAAVCLSGCSSVEERHDHLFRAGVILMRHVTPAPGWETRKEQFAAALESEIAATDTTK